MPNAWLTTLNPLLTQNKAIPLLKLLITVWGDNRAATKLSFGNDTTNLFWSVPSGGRGNLDPGATFAFDGWCNLFLMSWCNVFERISGGPISPTPDLF